MKGQYFAELAKVANNGCGHSLAGQQAAVGQMTALPCVAGLAVSDLLGLNIVSIMEFSDIGVGPQARFEVVHAHVAKERIGGV